MRLLFLISLFLTPTSSLDSETNSPTYKFAVVTGEPNSLEACDTLEDKTFEECLDKCEETSACVMVYQANTTGPCYMFQWNSVTGVRNNESGGVGTVGFKVYTEQPSCDLNLQFLLNGKIYPIQPNDTQNFLWRVDTAEEGWVITYLQKRSSDNLICGNFTFNRPYPDSCSPECSTTMVQLSAQPDPSDTSTDPPGQEAPPFTSWTDCLYWCYNTPECFVTYFNENSCKWWKNGEITELKKREVTEGHHMAVKIPLSQNTCKFTTDQLLKGSYPDQDPTWNIDTTSDGWSITQVKPQNLICGNFTANRPYKDSCNPECMITMIQLKVVPGPLTVATNNHTATTWPDCLKYCHQNPDCFVSYFRPDAPTYKCTWWSINNLVFMNRTNVPAGHHMAIKVPLSNRSCKLTTKELLQDQYYLCHNRIKQSFGRSFFKIRTTEKYYKLNTYLDEKMQYMMPMSGCEMNTVTSSINGNHLMCSRNQQAPGITQPEAKALCKEMDGDLVPERFYGVFESCKASNGNRWNDAVFPWTMSSPFGGNWGFKNAQDKKGLKVWIGLERDPVTKNWVYTREDWIIIDHSVINTCYENGNSVYVILTQNMRRMTWNTGEPKDLPDHNSAYVRYTYGQDYFPWYYLFSAPCNSTDIDGFNCGTDPQPKRGIPAFQKILDEYGVVEQSRGIYGYWEDNKYNYG
ncbi:unnamed protein product [Caenorhabditis brenneri]